MAGCEGCWICEPNNEKEIIKVAKKKVVKPLPEMKGVRVNQGPVSVTIEIASIIDKFGLDKYGEMGYWYLDGPDNKVLTFESKGA